MRQAPWRIAPMVALMIGAAQPAFAATGAETAPALLDSAAFGRMAAEQSAAPMFAEQVARTRAAVEAAMRQPISVPVPKDAAGGYTHEQHKRNAMAIHGAGLLYRLTGERRYADFARDILLQYARLYPRLANFPGSPSSSPGRLFWQSLNDSVWLVEAVQGYDAIRDTLGDQDRENIDNNVFRAMASFMTTDAARSFNLIHNHATWACAGVGMTGYVLRDHELIAMALKGTDRSGRAGFLRQIDNLFSPDGYYTEGPYYGRYAIQPFLLFARAIEHGDPGMGIFRYRDGVLLKAIRAAIQLSHDGSVLPLNDAMPDKTLRTEELYQAVAIGYAQTGDPGFLSVASWQGRTSLTPEGLITARDAAAGKASPFPYASALFRDGPDGQQGAVAVMRAGAGDLGQLLVAKNTAMGMGHGHYDKLSWLLYDNGNPIVTDYGSARFLNVESKEGGRYLKENETWAKQTVAHNTLVVDETSHFDGRWRDGERLWPRQLFFSGSGDTKVSTAEMEGAWPGVTFRRTLAQVPLAKGQPPVVVDLLRVSGGKPATYDLPLHYSGQIVDLGFAPQSFPAGRPVLGHANGYQHIWVDATAAVQPGNAWMTWLNNGRFYTYRVLPPPGATMILGESGANDPHFNLRREPVVIERVRDARDATLVAVLEPHGRTDPSEETTVRSRSGVASLRHQRSGDADLITLDLVGGGSVTLAVADSADTRPEHEASLDGRAVRWRGHFARIEQARP